MSDGQKTRQELLQELVRLRQWVGDVLGGKSATPANSIEGDRLLRLGLALCRVRDEVWLMRQTDDIEKVLEAVGDGLEAASVPFLYCGVNVIDDRVDPPAVTAYSMRQQGAAEKRWRELGNGVIVDFWRGGTPVYRRDLHSVDVYGESAQIPAMRAVVDMPFSHGTLAVSSTTPGVFDAEDLEVLENMAVVLSEGFRRLEDLQALEQRNRELEEANTDLRHAQVQLVRSAKMAALGDLVAGIAHELNTPAGAIGSMCHTLERAGQKLETGIAALVPPGHKQERGIKAALRAITDAGQVIGNGIQRISVTVRSLRNFARLDEGIFKIADVHEGLEDTLMLLGSQLEGRITIKRNYGTLVPIYCAPGQLNQVWMHLLTHSIQTTEGKGEIAISTGRENDQIYVQITDGGRGIPPEQQARLFDVGFETGNERVKMELAWAADDAIVRDHGGEIRVESTVGIGTTVTVWMPERTSDLD
jgi:signal transduction histidine kinase